MSCRENCCFDCRKQSACTLARKCYGKKDPNCVDWVGEIPCAHFEQAFVEVKLGEWQRKPRSKHLAALRKERKDCKRTQRITVKERGGMQ